MQFVGKFNAGLSQLRKEDYFCSGCQQIGRPVPRNRLSLVFDLLSPQVLGYVENLLEMSLGRLNPEA